MSQNTFLTNTEHPYFKPEHNHTTSQYKFIKDTKTLIE